MISKLFKNRILKKIFLILFFIVLLIFSLAVSLYLYYLWYVNNLKSERDTFRKELVKNVNSKVDEFMRENNALPQYIDLRFTVKIEKESIKNINLPIYLRFNRNADITSSELGSIFCYKVVDDKYAFGVKLESGEWFNVGAISCTDEMVPDKFDRLR